MMFFVFVEQADLISPSNWQYNYKFIANFIDRLTAVNSTN